MVAHPDESLSYAQKQANFGITNLLLGAEVDLEVPALEELTAATAALAIGSKRKALLPLATAAVEYALVRRGSTVFVSCYGTASAPVVYQLDRRVPLRRLLDTCAQAMLESAAEEMDPTARQIAVRVAERALATKIAPDPEDGLSPTNQRGGELDAPSEHVPLAFGYEAAIYPSSSASQSRSSRADVHALLFEGHLWAFVRPPLLGWLHRALQPPDRRAVRDRSCRNTGSPHLIPRPSAAVTRKRPRDIFAA